MPMPGDAKIRASDADRDRAAAALREHLAAGRLTIEEFDERLDQALAAKTLGELDQLMADLPVTDLGQLPSASLDRPAADPMLAGRASDRSIEAGRGRFPPARRAAWGPLVTISLLLFMIWVLSGATGGPWFLWVALPLGALILARAITGAPARRARRSARPRRDYTHRDDWTRRHPPW
jgi:hypothetical protein